MSREVEVVFSKRFTMRDDQPVAEAVRGWVQSMGFKYESHREVTNEASTADITLADCVTYISGGKASPSLQAYLRSAGSKPSVAATPEPDDQHDGAGAHWR